MTTDAVTYRSEPGVATITINRPAAMNRLDNRVGDGLHEAWKRLLATRGQRQASQ